MKDAVDFCSKLSSAARSKTSCLINKITKVDRHQQDLPKNSDHQIIYDLEVEYFEDKLKKTPLTKKNFVI